MQGSSGHVVDVNATEMCHMGPCDSDVQTKELFGCQGSDKYRGAGTKVRARTPTAPLSLFDWRVLEICNAPVLAKRLCNCCDCACALGAKGLTLAKRFALCSVDWNAFDSFTGNLDTEGASISPVVIPFQLCWLARRTILKQLA
jgi:hypothetical protein